MTVGFYHSARKHTDHMICALRLLRSVRQNLPGVDVVQFTTPESVRVSGVDDVRVLADGPVALNTLEAYGSCSGEWLFTDTDVLVQRDVRDVFDRPFDVAVAERDGTYTGRDLKPGRTFMKVMPYNKGAVFSRSPEFWRAALAVAERYPERKREWMGDQLAMNQVIAGGQFDVAVLPNSYNYPPRTRIEDVRDKHITHWKGGRKLWLLRSQAA